MRWISTTTVSLVFCLAAILETRAFAPSLPHTSLLQRAEYPLVHKSSKYIKQSLTKRFTHSIEKQEPQSVGAATFNLVKAIVGSGVLTLPSGLAVVTDAPKAVIPATLLVLFMGCLSAYSFYMIGRLCSEDGGDSLTDLWNKNVGKGGGVVTLSILVFTLGAALTYSICLGDAFSSLAHTVGLKGWLTSRQTSILAITLTALWPLCNLKNLAALAPFSVVGVVGTIVTCFFMAFRCVQPSGPYRLPDGSFLPTLATSCLPVFGTRSIRNLLSPSSLVLAAMSNCAYLAHYAAPDFYYIMGKDNTLSKFKKLVWYGFGGVFAINAAILIFGFLTFGGNCSGLVLNNYSTKDVGATFCRLLMALCVIGGFPFLVNASRQTFFELTDSGEEVSKKKKTAVTTGLVALITGLALVLQDAGVVVSFNGAVMGSAIIYIVPGFLSLKSIRRKLESGVLDLTKKVRLERFMSRFLVGFGVLSAILGGAVSIISKYFPTILR